MTISRTPARTEPHWFSSGGYLLLVISLVSVHQYLGQYLFSVALEPIKAEFHLSDSQLGAINGPAFLVFLGLAAIPIAHLAERLGRRQIIAASILAWSAFTALTALSTGFFALLVTRALVGVGQAGCGPAVQSLVAARFAPQKRSGAMGVMYASFYLGIFLGFASGGFLIRALGWRGAFMAAGVSGIALVPLVWFTLRDPPLSAVSIGDTVLRDVAAVLRGRGILHYLAMNALVALVALGTFNWAPTFYTRYYGMDSEQAGVVVGFILGGGSLIASLLGGLVVNRLERTREGAGSTFMMWCTLLSVPAGVGAFLVENRIASLAFLLLWTFLSSLPAGRIVSLLHDLVEPRHRAVAAALAVLGASLIGGMGPLVVGVISDLMGTSGQDTLRIGLMSLNLFALWTLLHMYKLGRVRRSLVVTAVST